MAEWRGSYAAWQRAREDAINAWHDQAEARYRRRKAAFRSGLPIIAVLIIALLWESLR